MTQAYSAGRLCIELAVTGGAGERSAFETIGARKDLASWFERSSLRVSGVRVTVKDLEAAHALREAIWDAATVLLSGGVVKRGTVDSLNRAAQAAPLTPKLRRDARATTWTHPTARAALSLVARDAIHLVADPAQRARLKQCASADCSLIFYDDSPPGRRRWCAANRCGDRMRARAYRARQRHS